MKLRIVRQIDSNKDGVFFYYAVEEHKGWLGWVPVVRHLPSLEIAENAAEAILNPVVKQYDLG